MVAPVARAGPGGAGGTAAGASDCGAAAVPAAWIGLESARGSGVRTGGGGAAALPSARAVIRSSVSGTKRSAKPLAKDQTNSLARAAVVKPPVAKFGKRSPFTKPLRNMKKRTIAKTAPLRGAR